MTFHLRPSRREPRPMLVLLSGRRLVYAALDPWELRSLGEIHARQRAALSLSLGRIVMQVRPTIFIRAALPGSSPPVSLDAVLRKLTMQRRLPILRLSSGMIEALRVGGPTITALQDAYPALRLWSDPLFVDAARLVARSLTHLALPSRSYAPRLSLRAKTRMGAAGASSAQDA